MLAFLGTAAAAAALATGFPEVESDERTGRFRGVLVASEDGAAAASTSGGTEGAAAMATAYPLASITKAFTGVLIMTLVEEGALDLAASVGSVLSSYADDPIGQVTVEQLLTHTAGVPDPAPGEPGSGVSSLADMARAVEGPGAVIAGFAGMELLFEPGSNYDYSNSGYVLLGAIAEAVTGLQYEDALRDRVLEPAGVADQFCLCQDLQGYPDAEGSEWFEGRETSPAIVHPSRAYAAGGLRGTPRGVLQWTEALLDGRILSPESLDALWQPRVPTRREGVSYGYGWTITELGGSRVVGHDGALPGIVTSFLAMPDEGRVSLGVLTRTLPFEHLSRSERYLAGLVEDTLTGEDRQAVPAFARTSRSYHGGFELPRGKAFSITEADEGLTLTTSGDWSVFQVRKLDVATGPAAEKAGRAASAWATGGQAAMAPMFSDGLRNALPDGALDGAWEGFEAEFGTLVEQRVYAVSDDQSFAEVRFGFERAAVDVGFVFDDDGMIDGVQMIGIETETPPTSVTAFPIEGGGLFVDGYRYGLDDLRVEAERGFWGLRALRFGKGDSLKAVKK